MSRYAIVFVGLLCLGCAQDEYRSFVGGSIQQGYGEVQYGLFVKDGHLEKGPITAYASFRFSSSTLSNHWLKIEKLQVSDLSGNDLFACSNELIKLEAIQAGVVNKPDARYGYYFSPESTIPFSDYTVEGNITYLDEQKIALSSNISFKVNIKTKVITKNRFISQF